MPKLRTVTVSGPAERDEPSRARRTKPPAKEISKRKRAALSTGGGKLPPALREEFDREGLEKRVKPARGKKRSASTRTGKRRPRHARFIETTEQHDRRKQRKSRTPETDAEARAIPATRITRNEPRVKGRNQQR